MQKLYDYGNILRSCDETTNSLNNHYLTKNAKTAANNRNKRVLESILHSELEKKSCVKLEMHLDGFVDPYIIGTSEHVFKMKTRVSAA